MEAILYKIDEINKNAEVVYRYRPTPDCISRALGSVDYINNLCIINKGAFFCSPSTNTITEIIDTTTQLKVAEYLTPNYQFSYQTRGTNWNVSLRPKVRLENGSLKTDSIPNLYNYKWYKIVDTSATFVGSGLDFLPSVNGNYVVQAQKDTGFIISYLVSDIINYTATQANNIKSSKTKITFIDDDNSVRIEKPELNSSLKVFNVNGQILLDKSINGDAIIPLSFSKGIYIVNYSDNVYTFSKKVFIK
jgi:hypothetical protein